MELFRELFFTMANCLIVSFVIATLIVTKLLSMASAASVADADRLIQEPKLHRKEESVVCGVSESDRTVDSVEDQLVQINDREEEEQQQLRFGKVKDRDCWDNKGSCEEEELASVGALEDLVGDGSFEIAVQAVESLEGSVFSGAEVKSDNETDGVVSNENDDEGWEGVERTELEKQFGAAVCFLGSKTNADRISLLGHDVKMQLYGLHKVAVEGPCWEPQPMALKVSARAKWNAWKLLGSMSHEIAMEQCINLLSRSIPDWMGDDTSG